MLLYKTWMHQRSFPIRFSELFFYIRAINYQELDIVPDTKKLKQDSSSTDQPTTIELPPPKDPAIIDLQTSLLSLSTQLSHLKMKYLELDADDRQHIHRAQQTLQLEVASLQEALSSAELLLFTGSTLKNYGQLTQLITQPELWASVFSFLNLSDFVRVSRVCRLWYEASKQQHALSSLQLTDSMHFDVVSPLEVFQKLFRHRLDALEVDGGSPVSSIMIQYMEWKKMRARRYVGVRSVDTYAFENKTAVLDERAHRLEVGGAYKNRDLSELPDMPNLKTLVLNGMSVSQLEGVMPDVTLRVTELDTNKWSDDILRMKNLTAMKFNGDEILESKFFEKMGPQLKKLTLVRNYGKSGPPAPGFLSHIMNIEKLTVYNRYYTNVCDMMDKFTKLKHLYLQDYADLFKNKPITITSNSIQTLKIQSFNSITINCPNLEHLSLLQGPKNGSDLVQINSKSLLTFYNIRTIHMLSIKGPNNLTRGKFAEVKSFTDMECPLLEKLIVGTFSMLKQNQACSRLIKQIRYLQIDTGDDSLVDLLQMPNSIEVLSISNWKIDKNAAASSKHTMSNLRKLELRKVNLDTLTFLNDLLKSSTTLEDLTLDSCNIGPKILDSISDEYVNLKYLTLSELVGWNSSKAQGYCKELKRKLKHLKLKMRSTTGDTGKMFVPEGVESIAISNLVSFNNTKSCKDLKRLDMNLTNDTFSFDQLQLFPNLKFLQFNWDITKLDDLDLVNHLPSGLEYLSITTNSCYAEGKEMKEKAYKIISEKFPNLVFFISDGYFRNYY